jgi:hypothetical protein
MSGHHQKETRAGDGGKYLDMIWSAIGAIAAITPALLLVADRNSPFLMSDGSDQDKYLIIIAERPKNDSDS